MGFGSHQRTIARWGCGTGVRSAHRSTQPTARDTREAAESCESRCLDTLFRPIRVFTSGTRPVALAAALLTVASAAAQTNAPNSDPGPDVIVGAIPDVLSYGSVDGVAAFSAGTTSCNAGTEVLEWFPDTPAHPVIAQNLYRLKDDRFEQIGMSWVKHAFAAINGNLCGFGCQHPGVDTLLGVGCSDPYTAGLNGFQAILGPRSEINASTGVFPYPFQLRPAITPTIGRRLQVNESDLDPALDGGGLYFIEGQYVTPDDAAAGNKNNNASFRPASLFFDGSIWRMSLLGLTQREKAAVLAWKINDPSVVETVIDVPGDGRFILAARVFDRGDGTWDYEYALQNLTSDRAAGTFGVPHPQNAPADSVGFHDVAYHSGEVYTATDWTMGMLGGSVTWSTTPFAEDVNANALRWGSLYNFRFTSVFPPETTTVTLGLFKPGSPESIDAITIGPIGNADDCNTNGVFDSLDIAAGTSPDCNQNDVPDECEVFPTTPLTTVRVATGLTKPVYLAAPPGDLDRIFVVEQAGRIKLLVNRAIQPIPFLDIADRVGSGGERGLFSMAFHPGFSENGFFYVNYTDLVGTTHIARFEVPAGTPDAANPESELTLKTISQDFANHNGGQLQFGPDGFLYVGMGDGGSGNDPFDRAQDPGTLLGKMLRLDVDNPPDYIPADNPFVGPDLPLDEIWASGLRNPWRFSFDPRSDDLYIADVGQDAVEEVSIQPGDDVGGANYGWRCMEGNRCTGLSGCTCDAPELTAPVLTYSHDAGECSITGGYVYGGCAAPDLSGTYFYADLCAGFIRSFRMVNGSIVESIDRTMELTPVEGPIPVIVSFGLDGAGELYIVSHAGDVYKIVPDVDGPICGNGLLEPSEECDDGNVAPGDGCDATCRLEPGIAHDRCGDALVVSEGTHAFDTTGATTDGPDEPVACAFAGDTQVGSDLWYCYEPSCSGMVTAALCGSSFDTKLAVYEGCVCPPADVPIACNDDLCGAQSEVSWPVTACPGAPGYLIRVGGHLGAQGLGQLTLSCDPEPIATDCNGNGVDDATEIGCEPAVDADSNGVLDVCETEGDFVRGGKLYDRWWAEIAAVAPAIDHPLWPFRPDPVSNTRTGADTWRCKECHGWDYKGVDGQYATGTHRTGFPGILGTALGTSELFTLLREPPSNTGGAGVLNGHDYGSVLGDPQIQDVVAFVRQALIDDDAFVEPVTGVFVGDASQGEIHYTTGGSVSCITCHGADGAAINFGTFDAPEFLGTVAVHNPWEFLHKVRVGQPGSPMPSWLAGGGTNAGAADIGRYAQTVFPVDCLFDEHCDDSIACTLNSCDAQGRCRFVADDALCTDDEVFCNGRETCNVTAGCVSKGNPCRIPTACDEAGAGCGCETPDVAAPGARYLSITPRSPGSSVPTALFVQPECAGGTGRYVGAPTGPDNIALLVDQPENAAVLTPAEWGQTVHVSGLDIVPVTAYLVSADCGAVLGNVPTDAQRVVSQRWGDVAGLFDEGAWTPPDGQVDVLDLSALVDGFRHAPTAPPLVATDQNGCVPDRQIDIRDLVAGLDGFSGVRFEVSTQCPRPCP